MRCNKSTWLLSLELTAYVDLLPQALIEREWLQGGYPFGTRHSKSAYAYALSSVKNQKKNYAPSFLLFIDCVWQIFNQFPFSFEFSEHFLITIVQHSYASQFGNFTDRIRYFL
jgi:myotubularin-related protein 9